MKPDSMLGRQRGQALTEFLVIALAMVPLFLLVPMIAKYQDIRHSTRMASRYVAFDAAVRNDTQSTWKPEAEEADEIRRRFFSNSDAPIKTGDVAGDFKANQNLFWRDPKGDALISKFSDITVSYGETPGTRHADGFKAASDGSIFNPVSGQLGLKARGIYTANVSVSIAKLPDGIKSLEPFNKLDLKMSRSTTVLIDPWTGRSPQAVEASIAGSPAIFPASALEGPATFASAAIATIEVPGGVTGPKLGKLDFWRDVVPEDRLRNR
jgi:hypothetical protein